MRSVGDGDFETMCTTQTLGELHEWPDMALYRERKQQGMRPWWTHSNLHLLQTKQQSNLEQIDMLEAAITVGQSPLQRIPTLCTAGYIVKEKKPNIIPAQHVQNHRTLRTKLERLSWREDQSKPRSWITKEKQKPLGICAQRHNNVLEIYENRVGYI